MDKEISREAFLKAIHSDPEENRRDQTEDEEFVYRGNVKKDLELTGLEYISLDGEAQAPEEDAAGEAAVPGEPQDLSVRAVKGAGRLLKKIGDPVGKLLLFLLAPIVKPFRKSADTITRRDWAVFVLLLAAVASAVLFANLSMKIRNTYKEKEALYSVYMGLKEPYGAPSVFTVDEDGDTILENSQTTVDVTGDVLYYEGQDRLLWPVTGVWYDMESTICGRVDRFATVEAGQGSCTLKPRKGKESSLKGVLYDNSDTYVFLEAMSLQYNEKQMTLLALSMVKVGASGALEAYPYGSDEGVFEELTTDAYAVFGNGARINLGMDTMYYFNGSLRLMYISLDAINPVAENIGQ